MGRANFQIWIEWDSLYSAIGIKDHFWVLNLSKNFTSFLSNDRFLKRE